MIEQALAYAKIGWHVLPLHSTYATPNGAKRCTCGNVKCVRSMGKHPRTLNGVKDATIDQEKIKQWWSEYPDANIGIATGSISGFYVWDIDTRAGGLLSHDDLIDKHGQMPHTNVVRTGGEQRGYHYYFRTTMPVSSHSNIAKGIDLKGDGGYVVAPPSITTNPYEFEDDSDPLDTGMMPAEAPTWLESLVYTKAAGRTKESAAPTRVLSEQQMTEIRSALHMLALTNSADDYDTWIKVGMALHSTETAAGYQLWTEWSASCPEKYDIGTCRQKWASFKRDPMDPTSVSLGTLFHLAQQAGWDRPVPIVKLKSAEEISTELTAKAPESILRIHGELQRFVNWSLSSATRKQPKLTVAAALTLGASVMAQRYQWAKTRTNLMQIAVAPSTSGKEHPRNCIKMALRAAMMEDRMIGEDIKSGSALYNAVHAQPKALSLIDEYGLLLQGVTREGASQHKREFAEVVMKIATSANTVVLGPEYADRKTNPRRDLFYPCINVMGSTTMATLEPALSSAQAADGFLNRHLLVVSENALPEANNWVEDEPVPAELVQWMVNISTYSPRPDLNMLGISPESPIVLKCEADAQTIIDDFGLWCDQRRAELFTQRDIGVIWGRAVEQAKKVAMVVSGSMWKKGTELVVRTEAAKWAVEYVRHCTYSLELLVTQHMADSPYERVLNDVLRVIRDAGPAGATLRDLTRSAKGFRAMDPQKQTGLLKSLAAEGIMYGDVETKGRPRAAYIDERYVDMIG